MLRKANHEIKRKLSGAVRRYKDAVLPSLETREYQRWMKERLTLRREFYNVPLQTGLLSIITPVWNGSPVSYLKKLAESIAGQNEKGACEWVILNNGCSKPALLAYLTQLRSYSWVQVESCKTNIGITRGLRLCLERASGCYVLPVDADDWLYPDALRIVAWALRNTGYPQLLFTDEDKILGDRHYQPYFKPAWDPVLLLNSAYTAHLGVIDRRHALYLGAYRDPAVEASPDWDLFVRFLSAGVKAVHIPEVLYSWRVHASSTADDAASKSNVSRSQKAVLQRFLDAAHSGHGVEIENSPLLPGAPHWHFVSSHPKSPSFETVVISPAAAQDSFHRFLPLIESAASRGRLIHFIGGDVEIDNSAWPSEVLTLIQLHTDIVMIGGRIRNRRQVITGAGQYFGICGICGCPHRGLSADDPGYFAQIWKQRSVSAVTTQFAVVNPCFLLEIAPAVPASASLSFLGAWIGAEACRRVKRIVYSPFLSGISELDWQTLPSKAEQENFARENGDILPDTRFYSPALSILKGFKLGPATYPPRAL
jgi:hypothetical protein